MHAVLLSFFIFSTYNKTWHYCSCFTQVTFPLRNIFASIDTHLYTFALFLSIFILHSSNYCHICRRSSTREVELVKFKLQGPILPFSIYQMGASEVPSSSISSTIVPNGPLYSISPKDLINYCISRLPSPSSTTTPSTSIPPTISPPPSSPLAEVIFDILGRVSHEFNALYDSVSCYNSYRSTPRLHLY